MKALNLPDYSFRIQQRDNKKWIFDPMRRKFVVLTPEEWVRQNFVLYLIRVKGYPQSLIAVEPGLKLGRMPKRADVVIYDSRAVPLAIVECKAPEVPIDSGVFDQVVRYNMALHVKYIMMTNGMVHYCCRLNYDDLSYRFLEDIPTYEHLLTS
ncbi:MAG: type I restriction enzyme HsdR N-terminal domain-containing protein [Bacteroidales bacterium]